jgi:hypothetical protein
MVSKSPPMARFTEILPTGAKPLEGAVIAHTYPVPGLAISGGKIWSINKRDYLKLEEAPMRRLRPFLGLYKTSFFVKQQP